MAVHYARQKGIPACGLDVVDNTIPRTSKWNSSTTRQKGTRSVTVPHETSKVRSVVDCAACEPYMDMDRIPLLVEGDPE